MKNFKRILALVLTVMTVVACVVVPANAADSSVTYNETALVRLQQLGIFKGSTSGDLHADDLVTRGEMALFTARVNEGKVDKNYWESYENDTTFEDIDTQIDEIVGAISYSYEKGIVNGKSEVRFDPKGNVLYRDALAMVVRALGYTSLSYPNGVINKAIKLGLTDGIDGVAYDEPALRGVVGTILYNALYAENSAIAEKFNLTSGTYMLVSAGQFTTADNEVLPVASINGYNGKVISSEHVAFAALKADNTVDNSSYVYAKKDVIDGDITVNYATRLGYLYDITFEGDEIAWVSQLEAKTFKNYGDDRQIGKTTTLKYATAEGTFVTDAYLTLDGKAYNLVDHWSDDNATPVATEDLILYKTDAGAVNVYDYQYAANGNILGKDDAGNIVEKFIKGSNIGRTSNKYYVAVTTTGTTLYREATAEELYDAKYVVSYQESSCYDIFLNDGTVSSPTSGADSVKTISDNYFCDIVTFDVNGDGEYDLGVYTPYYIGYASSSNATKNTFTMVGGYAISDTFKNWTGASSFGEWAWVIYSVNPLCKQINLIEKLTDVSGKVTWTSKGAPNAYGIYDQSSAKIGNSTWKLGGWSNENLCGLDIVAGNPATGNAGMDNVPAKTFANNISLATTGYYARYNLGWNDLLTIGMMDSRYVSFKGYAIAGHLVWGYPTTAAATYNHDFVAFDPYVSTFAIEDDCIVVKALTDTTGVYKDVKIKSIDGEEFTNIEMTAFFNYIDSLYSASTAKGTADAMGIKYSYFFNDTLKAKFMATEGYKVELRKLIITQLCVYNSTHTAGRAQLNADKCGHVDTQFYSISKTNTDGSLALSVVNPVDMYGAANATSISFKFGVSSEKISTVKNGTVALNCVLATTDKTVFTFVAKDGIYTYVGKPLDGDSLVLTADTAVYAANADAVMIIDESRNVDEIAVGTYSWTGTCKCEENDVCVRDHVDTWGFEEATSAVLGSFVNQYTYLITANTKNVENFVDENGTPVYTYSGLYDLKEQKEVEVIFVGHDAEVFNAAFVVNGTESAYSNLGTIVTKNDGEAPVVYKLTDAANYVNDQTVAAKIFNLTGNVNSFNYTKAFTTIDVDNNTDWAHVSIDGTTYTVRGVSFVVVNCKATGSKITKCELYTDFAKVAANSTAVYTYNTLTGELTGYAFKVQ